MAYTTERGLDGASPYSPLTRRFWDERWVDPEWVATRLGAAAPTPRPVVASDLADHEAAWTSTRAALAEVLGGFDGLPEETATWRSHHPEVEQWARWKAAALVAGWDPTVWTDELDLAVRSSDDAVLASHQRIGNVNGLDLGLHDLVAMSPLQFISEGLTQLLAHGRLNSRSRSAC